MRLDKALFKASLALITLCVTVGSTSAVHATDLYNPSPTNAIELRNPAAGQKKITARDKDYTPLGIHSGGFFYYPAVEIGARYNDNVFYLPDDLAESDYIANLRGSLSMNSNWSRHEFNLLGSADLGYYQEYDNEDYKDYVLAADGRYDVLRGSFATARAGYMKLHESRSSLDNRFGTTPTKYDYSYLGAGYDHQPAKFRTLFTFDYGKLDYDNVTNIFGQKVDNHDRDRTRPEAILRLGYEYMQGRRLFIQGAVNKVDYDQKVDNSGQERSSKGYKVTSGINFNLTNLLVGDVFIGYVNQNYDDPDFSDISDPLVGFHLTWMPTGLTTFDLNLDRKPQETTEPTASGYLSTIFSVRVEHELKRNIILFGIGGYTENKYEQNVQGLKEKENITDVGLGGKYLFSRRFYASADYRYQRRRSDIATQEYNDNQVMLALGANW